jgi:hypothetical protein
MNRHNTNRLLRLCLMLTIGLWLLSAGSTLTVDGQARAPEAYFTRVNEGFHLADRIVSDEGMFFTHLAILVGWAGMLLRISPSRSRIVIVLAAGWIGTLAALIFPALLRPTLAIGMVGSVFWLMSRFSRVRRDWVAFGALNCANWLSLAATCAVWLPPGWVGVAAIMVAHAIFASHIHRALIDPGETRTLAAYWVGLGVILLLLGEGIDAILTLPGIPPERRATTLAATADWLAATAALAIVLGGVNQIGSEQRLDGRRITGLLPFWCVAFGALIIGLSGLIGGWALFSYELGLHADNPTFRTSQISSFFPLNPLPRLDHVAGMGQILMLTGANLYTLGALIRWPRKVDELNP